MKRMTHKEQLRKDEGLVTKVLVSGTREQEKDGLKPEYLVNTDMVGILESEENYVLDFCNAEFRISVSITGGEEEEQKYSAKGVITCVRPEDSVPPAEFSVEASTKKDISKRCIRAATKKASQMFELVMNPDKEIVDAAPYKEAFSKKEQDLRNKALEEMGEKLQFMSSLNQIEVDSLEDLIFVVQSEISLLEEEPEHYTGELAPSKLKRELSKAKNFVKKYTKKLEEIKDSV